MEIKKDTLEFDDNKYLSLMQKEEKSKKALEKQEKTVMNKQRLLDEAKEKFEQKKQEYEIAVYERKSYLVNAIPEDELTKVLNKFINSDTFDKLTAGTTVNDKVEDINLKELEDELYDEGIE